MNTITPYDIALLLLDDPLADEATLEKRMAEKRDLEAERQRALAEEAEIRSEMKAARQLAKLVSVLGLLAAWAELLRRSKDKLPPTNLIEPVRTLQAMGLPLSNIPAFADAPPVEADYAYLFAGWPEEFRQLAEKVVRSACRWPELLQKLINELPEGCLVNGAVTARDKPAGKKRQPLPIKGKDPSFTLEIRAHLCQKAKDLGKELSKIVGKDALPSTTKGRYASLLGDYEAVQAFEEEWKANIPGGDRLSIVLPDKLMRLADLLLTARRHLSPEEISRFATKLLVIRREIPVSLAPDAQALLMMGHNGDA